MQALPLSQRRIDIVIIGFFLINLLLVSYLIDIEQIVIADPYHFTYPIWPPGPVIDAVHWWGSNFDPLLMARPVFFKVTIWLDNLLYGPFYVIAIYAFWKGRAWIRIPAIIYAVSMISGVIMILSEEAFGLYRTPHLALVIAANLSWIIFPLLILVRLGWQEHPFSKVSKEREAVAGSGEIEVEA